MQLLYRAAQDRKLKESSLEALNNLRTVRAAAQLAFVGKKARSQYDNLEKELMKLFEHGIHSKAVNAEQTLRTIAERLNRKKG